MNILSKTVIPKKSVMNHSTLFVSGNYRKFHSRWGANFQVYCTNLENHQKYAGKKETFFYCLNRTLSYYHTLSVTEESCTSSQDLCQNIKVDNTNFFVKVNLNTARDEKAAYAMQIIQSKLRLKITFLLSRQVDNLPTVEVLHMG